NPKDCDSAICTVQTTDFFSKRAISSGSDAGREVASVTHGLHLMRCGFRVVSLLIGSSAALAIACTKTDTSVTAPTAERCSVSATSAPSAFAAAGGQGTVTIVTARDCTWSVATDASWVAIAGERSGQG